MTAALLIVCSVLMYAFFDRVFDPDLDPANKSERADFIAALFIGLLFGAGSIALFLYVVVRLLVGGAW